MRRFIVLAAALCAALILPAHAAASPTLVLRQSWMTNGQVYSTKVGANGDTYVVGSFSRVSPPVGNAVPFGPIDGQPDLAFPRVSGAAVNAAVSDGAGGWYLGGSFTSVAGQAVSGLAHVRADGSLDPSLAGDQPDGTVRALMLLPTTLYVGGDFAHLGTASRAGLGSIDATSGALLGARVGDKLEVKTPGGVDLIEILAIETR